MVLTLAFKLRLIVFVFAAELRNQRLPLNLSFAISE